MSDQHPNGEDIARMLREQGPVQAPPDLADEVMRQVRAEPQERPKPARRFRMPQLRSVLVPAIGLALVAALIVGIAHAPHGSSSSSAGASSAAGGGTEAAAPRVLHSSAARRAFAIPAGSAKSLSIYGPLTPPAPSGTATSNMAQGAKDNVAPYTLTLRGVQYAQALHRLRGLAAAHKRHPHEPTVVVILRRKP